MLLLLNAFEKLGEGKIKNALQIHLKQFFFERAL